MLDRVNTICGRRNTAGAMLVVLIVASIGTTLALQGWKSRIQGGDFLVYIDGAHELITNGRLPDRGTLTSFASYAPPGTAWLMVPGVLLFTDPRLYEYPGSTILYFGTLVGIFLLARAYFGVGCALLAVAIYGLSFLGLGNASGLWPRGHPFFYVWMVYWTTRWVMSRKTTYLAAAIVTWAAGMYVFMEIAPAIFILPMVWWFYRPPLKFRPLLLGTLLALAVWYPYLRFESTRNFVDLQSQVLRHSIRPANYTDSWCNPNLTMVNLEGRSTTSNMDPDQTLKGTDSIWSKVLLTLVQPLWERRNLIAAGFFSNFQQNSFIPGTKMALSVLVLIGLIVLSVSTTSTDTAEIIVRRWRFWLPWFAGGLILLGVLWNEFFIARYLSLDGILEASTISTIRWQQIMALLMGGALLILRGRIIVFVERFVRRVATSTVMGAQTMQPPDGRLLALSLIIPWLILVSIVEINRVIRFWWLWPLQVVVLAASVTYLPSRFQMPRVVTWIGSLSLIVMLVVTPSTVLRIEAGLRTGWAGNDPEEVQVIDYVVSRLDARRQAAIGYQLFIPRFYAAFNAVDARYRIGADFDLLFKARHRVLNTNVCAEGVSPDDEFRIVQTKPTWTDPAALDYFSVPLDRNFRLLRQFGSYQVFQRS